MSISDHAAGLGDDLDQAAMRYQPARHGLIAGVGGGAKGQGGRHGRGDAENAVGTKRRQDGQNDISGQPSLRVRDCLRTKHFLFDGRLPLVASTSLLLTLGR